LSIGAVEDADMTLDVTDDDLSLSIVQTASRDLLTTNILMPVYI
jgi:hypothetical protein